MLGRFVRWLHEAVIHPIGYLAGYRSGWKKSKQLRTRAIDDAARQAYSLVEVAGEEVRQMKWQAEQSIEEIVEKGHDKGHAAGFDAGLLQGLTEGRATGRQESRLAVASRFGLLVTDLPAVPDGADVTDASLAQSHANIYQTRDTRRGWLNVRIVAEGVLKRRAFAYNHQRLNDHGWTVRYVTDKASWVQAMLDAIAWRDQYIDNSQTYRALVTEVIASGGYDRLLLQPGASHETVIDAVHDVAVAFHQRVTHSDLEVAQLEFLGEDPEDRLGIEDATILSQPWTNLYGDKIPARVADAMRRLGLGKTQSPRSVRDVLLFTASDFLGCPDIGPVTLAGFRRRLGAHGLALWGDTIERPPVPPPQHGGRNLRAIDLNYGDEDE